MKMTFLHRWIFATIILIGATLPVDVFGTSTLPIYQVENVVTQKPVTKVVRYQKAKQLVATNSFFNFHFINYLSQNNIDIDNQLKSTTQQVFPFPIDFKSLKIITTKNTDDFNGLILS